MVTLLSTQMMISIVKSNWQARLLVMYGIIINPVCKEFMKMSGR